MVEFMTLRRGSCNGTCEASIRHLNFQTEYIAVCEGGPGAWTSGDLVRAPALRAVGRTQECQTEVALPLRAAFAATVKLASLQKTRVR
jgi:hypothetical protein